MYLLVNLRNKILPILKTKRWTQEEFAEKCSLTKPGLINILNNNDTKISTLITMCEVLELPINSLFTNENNQLPQVNEDRPEYSSPNITDKYAQCLENNNLLLTELRQCKQELEAIKKQGRETKERVK